MLSCEEESGATEEGHKEPEVAMRSRELQRTPRRPPLTYAQAVCSQPPFAPKRGDFPGLASKRRSKTPDAAKNNHQAAATGGVWTANKAQPVSTEHPAPSPPAPPAEEAAPRSQEHKSLFVPAQSVWF
ncbi:uncharacterized protein LOC144171290 [Haemaphysalis longicornis]